MSEAIRIKREIEREIECELAGVGPQQARAFCDLVDSCSECAVNAAHVVASTLLALEEGVRRNEQLLLEFRSISLEAYCNANRFEPGKYVAAILRALGEGLRRSEQLVLELRNPAIDLDVLDNQVS